MENNFCKVTLYQTISYHTNATQLKRGQNLEGSILKTDAMSSRLPSNHPFFVFLYNELHCGVHTNRKWNYGHASVLPFIFVSCSLTIEEVGRNSYPLKKIFYFLFYFFLVVFFLNNQIIHLSSFFIMNCGIHKNRKWNVCTSSHFCQLFTDH